MKLSSLVRTGIVAIMLGVTGGMLGVAGNLAYAEGEAGGAGGSGASGASGSGRAADICNNAGIPDNIKVASGCTTGGSSLPPLENVIVSIINGVIGVVGVVAVIFIVVGGYKYMTSNGDTTKVEQAKKTILYACIGLIVCALSFAIVNFMIVNIIGGQGGGASAGSGAGGGNAGANSGEV